MNLNWAVLQEYTNQIQEGTAIAKVWTIGDVKRLAPDLTDEEAMNVLQRVDENYNEDVGINWDVIQNEIDDYILLYEEAK